MLQRAQPARVDVEHQVRPGLAVDGVAGVDRLRIDDHHGAAGDPLACRAVEVGAGAGGDRADGKGLVTVRRIADPAPIGDRPRLEEGQGGVAPEAWLAVVRVVHVVPAVIDTKL